jgi:hypothetical protein
MDWRQGDQQMKMVGCTSGGEQSDSLGPGNSGDVPAQRVRVRDEIGPVFGAKDAVDQIRGMCVRHVRMVKKNNRGGGDPSH